MCDTAEILEVHPREISFSTARDAWLAFHDELETLDDIVWIIHSSGSHLVRNRPGRNEPRAIKRGHSKYPKLKEPRPSHRCRKKHKKIPKITRKTLKSTPLELASVSPANARVLNRQFQFNTPSNTETHASKNPTPLSTHCTKFQFENLFSNLSLRLFKTVGDPIVHLFGMP